MIVDCPAEVWYGTNGAIVRSGELQLHSASGTGEVAKDECKERSQVSDAESKTRSSLIESKPFDFHKDPGTLPQSRLEARGSHGLRISSDGHGLIGEYRVNP